MRPVYSVPLKLLVVMEEKLASVLKAIYCHLVMKLLVLPVVGRIKQFSVMEMLSSNVHRKVLT